MAEILERDVALVTKDSSGNTVIEFPLTRAEMVEDLEEAVAAVTVTKAASADSATKLAEARNISLTGDATAEGSFDGSEDITLTATLVNSGVTAGAYGPSANASPAHGGNFSVPYITVDAKGRVTAASTKAITLPAAASGVSLSTNVTVTKSTQAAIAPSAPSWNSAARTTRTYFNTVAGLAAGTYTLQNLLQNLVNKSHTHSKLTVTVDCDCNCNCDCADDCGG